MSVSLKASSNNRESCTQREIELARAIFTPVLDISFSSRLDYQAFVLNSLTNENWTAASTASAIQGRQFAQNTPNGNCLNFQSSEHVRATAVTHHLNKCCTETD